MLNIKAMLVVVVLLSSACGVEGEPSSASIGEWRVASSQLYFGGQPTCDAVPVPTSLAIGESEMIVRFVDASPASPWKEVVDDGVGPTTIGFTSLDTPSFESSGVEWVLDAVAGIVAEDGTEADAFITVHHASESSDLRCVVMIHASRI